MQRLKREVRPVEDKLIAEAEQEEEQELDEQMSDLKPLTPQQVAGLRDELEHLQSAGQLPKADAQRLQQLDSILKLDAARKSRSKGKQRLTSAIDDDYADVDTEDTANTAELDDFTGFGDTPLPPFDDAGGLKVRRQQDSEPTYLKREKKRPNRVPFNPLPSYYRMDDETDQPSEVAMDRAEWEEVDDADQKLVRAYMGLQRLRRNEQKLTRLLQMAKPSKRDLLLLLNEVDALEGKDRLFMERYVGPKLGWDQLEHDLTTVYDWMEREESDIPELIGDTETIRALRQMAGPKEKGAGENEGGEGDADDSESLGPDDADAKQQQQPKINAAGVNVMHELQTAMAVERVEKADYNRRALANKDGEVMTEEEAGTMRLYQQWDELQERKDAEEANGGVQSIEPRGAMLADDRHRSDLTKLITLNPAAYDLDHEDDEYQEPEGQEETEMEVDLLLDMQDRHKEQLAKKAERRTDAEKSKERSEQQKQLAELSKDETVQALLSKEELAVLLKNDDELTAEDAKLMRAALVRDEKELDTLQSLSSVFRVKQEVVAEWRALLKAAGEKLDERAVHEFMREDDDSIASAWREDDDVLEQVDEIERVEHNRAIQAVRKQKRWIADQIKRVGEERVKQAISDGTLQLKTHTGLQTAMYELLSEQLQKGMSEADQLSVVLESEMAGLDDQLSEMFGVRAEDVKKLREGQDVDESKLFLSKEELAKRAAEMMLPNLARIEEAMGDSVRSWTERNLSEEADAAEQSGDALAAKKLRQMHARRVKHNLLSGNQKSSLVTEQLREKGKLLAGEQSGRSIQHALYGRISAEETEANRQLIARGDGDDPRFLDAPLDDAPQTSILNPSTLSRSARSAFGFPDATEGGEQKDQQQLALDWLAMDADKRSAISDSTLR